jgi:hypothetical protein
MENYFEVKGVFFFPQLSNYLCITLHLYLTTISIFSLILPISSILPVSGFHKYFVILASFLKVLEDLIVGRLTHAHQLMAVFVSDPSIFILLFLQFFVFSSFHSLIST